MINQANEDLQNNQLFENNIFRSFQHKKLYNLMSFLQKLWQGLDQKKKLQQDKEGTLGIEWKQVYPGFRTIPIQILDPKPPKAAIKKDNKNGAALWGSAKRRILTYQQNVNITHPTENGFFSTFYQAYMNHGDIKITPDQIWLSIMLWFTKYVDENSEQLRNAFVTHAGKKKLIVKTMSADIKEWNEFFDKVIEEIKINTVKGVAEKLECNFSSTSRFERLFSTAIIMNTFKKYVDYQRQGGMCGIQNIHMGGNLEDWIKLKNKLGCLAQFDVNGQVKQYIKGLTPVLDQFIQTYKGHANIEFWNNIYQERINPPSQQYIPSTTIDGWLIKFFTISDQISQQNQLTIERITVDIKFVNMLTGQSRDVKLLGGCKGYAVEQDKVYRPHFSFVIAETIAEKAFSSIKPKKEIIRETKKQMIKEVIKGPIKLKKSPYQEQKKENKQIKSKTLPKGLKKK